MTKYADYHIDRNAYENLGSKVPINEIAAALQFITVDPSQPLPQSFVIREYIHNMPETFKVLHCSNGILLNIPTLTEYIRMHGFQVKDTQISLNNKNSIVCTISFTLLPLPPIPF
jgi:hypothetical protein